MVSEPEIIVHNREQLIALLTEAAEIEHGLMCCYLYAAFSLRTGDDSGLSSIQLEATRRWRGVILDVAVEEMLHLGLVANLMTAIGATPHFSRPNFPVAPGYYPAGVVVELAPFSKETIDHFVFLERPEGVDLPDGVGFGPGRPYERATRPDVLVPSAQDFLTVGHLYRSIENGFGRLSRELGEAQLFIGHPDAQITPAIGRFNELIAVTNLERARAALEAIVEQGEGSPGHSQNSHYVKFCGVRDELAALAAADPRFAPAWPAARNPVMRKPPTPEGKVHVTAPDTARLLDLGNAIYGLMLRCLMGVFGQPAVSHAQRRFLYETAINLMHAIVPVAEQLARIPATTLAPSPTAGLTFTLPRSITPVSDPRLLPIIAERADDIAKASPAIADHAGLMGIPTDLARIASSLATAAGASGARSTAGATTAVSATAEPDKAQPPPPPMPVEEAIGRDITIRFDGRRCIHARFCVLQAPTVFKANTPGTWIYPDTVDAERLVAVAEQCPSGAITYVRHDGRAEQAPPVNVVRLRENGPYAVYADIELAGHARMIRATLCRCGASKNKPFCDGSHKEIGFTASGEPETRPSEPLAKRGGTLVITPQMNGPLAVSGSIEICAGTGRTVDRVTIARLCRCGGSHNKPFCDGTHARIGFRTL